MNRINSQFFWLAGLICILLIPNILLVFFGIDSMVISPLKKIVYLIISTAFFLIPLLFFRPKLYSFFSIFLVVFLVFETFIVINYKTPSTSEIVSTVFYTNYEESKEFFLSHLSLGLFGFIFLAVIFFIYKKLKRSFRLSNTIKKAIVLLVMIVFGGLFIRDLMFSKSKNKDFSGKEHLLFSLDMMDTKFRKVFPVSFIYNAIGVKSGLQKMRNYKENTQNIFYNAVKRDTVNQPEIYVLVIGETARKHNFHLYGYARETTPRLDSIESLIPFTDVTASANLTALSIPIMLTEVLPSEFDHIYENVPVNKVFEEAGFKTYWLTNQPSGINGQVGIYARTNNVYKNVAVSVDAAQYDDILLKELDMILNDDTSDKKFIVIHTLGSHFRYSFRYPVEFEKFKPSAGRKLSLNENNISKKEEIINAYDNSILYTDFILSEMIKRVDSENKVSYMYYISDHGENLFDDDNGFFMHGLSNPTKYEIEIPLLVWYSDEYKELYPSKVENMWLHKDKKISGTYTFNVLLDMADIYYPSEEISKSFTNGFFKEDIYREIYTPTNQTVKLYD